MSIACGCCRCIRRHSGTMATTSRTTAASIRATAHSTDFGEFLDAAHARGLRVITELVLNHTSDQHAWFKEARRSARRPAA